MRLATLAITALILLGSGCAGTDAQESPKPSEANVLHAEPQQTVTAIADTSLEVCQGQNDTPSNRAESPPVNAKGLFANKGECRGCSLGWWHSSQDIALYAEPDFAAQQLKTVPSGVWLYALETVAFVAPTRGVVVKAGGAFKTCDVVYYVYTNYDEGESWDLVWRQGEVLEYQTDSGAEIQWIGGLQRADPYKDDGWWVRLRGQNGETGWAWASAREYEFACKWDRDPEAICASAPPTPTPSGN